MGRFWLFLGLVGCQTSSPGAPKSPWVEDGVVPVQPIGLVEDRIVQAPPSSMVDTLWVVDPHSGMAEDHGKLRASLHAYAEPFALGGLNSKMAVLSTDSDALGVFQAGDTPLDAAEFRVTDFADVLSAVGSDSEEPSHGLATIQAALESDDNQGFFRPSAVLQVVILSDRDDASEIDVDEFVDWFAGLKPDPALRTLSVIVPSGSTRYEAASEALGGIRGDVHDVNYSESLHAIAQHMGGSEFFLSHSPHEDTLEVELIRNGLVERIPRDEWAYEPTRNAINLLDVVPELFSEVVVSYTDTREIFEEW